MAASPSEPTVGGGSAGPDELAGSDEDSDLARRFVAGDDESVRRLYARYAGPVFTVAISRLADRHLAEEAVQETFLKAWRARATFEPDRSLSPWIYMIARRTAADIARREHRRPRTTPLSATIPADDPDPSGDAWESWQVRCALRDLGSDERELIRLAHYVGLTQTQIAERTGLPLGTVKSRLHRAYHRLAERLAHLRVIA